MSFAAGSVAKGSGVVVLVNGANGMVIMPDLVGELMPGDHPAFAWPQLPAPAAAAQNQGGQDAKGKDLEDGKGFGKGNEAK
jgi:hypothetical protein